MDPRVREGDGMSTVALPKLSRTVVDERRDLSRRRSSGNKELRNALPLDSGVRRNDRLFENRMVSADSAFVTPAEAGVQTRPTRVQRVLPVSRSSPANAGIRPSLPPLFATLQRAVANVCAQ